MKRTLSPSRLALVLSVPWLLSSMAAALGAGCIVPFPPPRPPRPPIHIPPYRPGTRVIRLVDQRTAIRLRHHVAQTTITQVFRNDAGYTVEGTYFFPLPAGAALSGFALFQDGKRIEGEVLERDKARRIFRDIVQRLRDPALLEYADYNVLQARVFPMPPRGERKVEVRYSIPVRRTGDAYRYTLPLRVDQDPGRPLRQLVIDGEIETREPLKSVYSPTHKLDVHRRGDHRAEFSFEKGDIAPERDFVLYYTVSDDAVAAAVVAHRRGGEAGYFMLMVSPRAEWSRQEITAKDVVFVFDTSGSMAGKKIEQAKAALRFCLQNLNPDDRFGIVSFSTQVRAFRDKLATASQRNRRDALDFVDDLKARGGTDIDTALASGLKLTPRSQRPTMVIFLTDGLPTVGRTDVEAILEHVRDLNWTKDRRRARIFTWGVGFDVNTHLLDKVAQGNGGDSDYVRPNEDIEVAVSAFYNKIAYPVMSDLSIDFRGIKTYDRYPTQLPDLFRGSQLTLFGRYEKDGRTELRLRGRIGGKERTLTYRVEFPRREPENDSLPRLWATRKVGYLLDQIRLHGDEPELRREIVDLGTRFGIITPYTSFLAQEDERPPVVFRPRPPIGPVPLRPGVGGEKAPRQSAPAPAARPAGPADLAAQVGRAAVTLSQTTRVLRRADAESERQTVKEIRHVGNRWFVHRNGVWVDGAHNDKMPKTRVKFMSEAYFQLLDRLPQLRPVFALGDQVTVCLGKQCVEVGDAGKETLTEAELAALVKAAVTAAR